MFLEHAQQANVPRLFLNTVCHTQMLEELTWVPLLKRRENAHLILFYKIINNLAMVPHLCLEKADGRTRKKHNLKFRHIGYNVDPYGQSFFPKCISAWNGLAQEIAKANCRQHFGPIRPHQQTYSSSNPAD